MQPYLYLLCGALLFISGQQYAAIEIIELPPNQWRLFKDLRIISVKDAGQAFDSTYEEELTTAEFSWRQRLYHNMIFAKIGGEIVGMIGAYICPRSKMQHAASLISFYVLPKYRSCGVGSLLLSTIIDKLNRMGTISKISLKVTSSQTDAIALYKKFGFCVEGVLKNEYCIDGVYYDQLIMRKC